MHLPDEATIRLVILTVVISIFGHGLSARPSIELYARAIASLDASAPEHQEFRGKCRASRLELTGNLRNSRLWPLTKGDPRWRVRAAHCMLETWQTP